MEAVGFYNTKKELDREMGKHRRELLTKVAQLYKQEREEFYQKYRLFQLHKWEILKVIKKRMMEQRMRDLERAKLLRAWII